MTESSIKIRNIPIALPSLGEEEWQAAKEPIFSGWLTQGPKVAEFERKFAEIHDVNNALAVTSCTTALHLALASMGVGPGDEVIVPAFTWVATANVVLYCGATPVFCDIDRETFNINVEELASKITDRTKVVIPVHLFGLCADIDAIKAVIPPNVKVLEDAACAAGAIYKGRYAGSLGDMAAFSFHPRKSITTGEGGMLTSNDDILARKANIMRSHGAESPAQERHKSPAPYILPEIRTLGFNYRMSDLQAAIGIVQLDKLKLFINERQKWADYYRKNLSNISWLHLQKTPGVGSQHSWQSFVVYVDPEKSPLPRNEIMEKLQARGISTRPGTHAVHMLDFYKVKYGIHPDDFPAARDCDRNTMAIPLHNQMTEDDFKYIVEELHAI